jgi:hypothetical protein
MNKEIYVKIMYGLAYVFATAILILSYLGATDVIPTFVAIAIACLVAAGSSSIQKKQ